MSESGKGTLVWIDLEMTGLDPDRYTILEIATIVTADDLTLVAEGPTFAIHHPDEVLEAMEAWSAEQHRASGLTERARRSTVSMREAEERTLDFLRRHVPAQTSPLCGNSVCQDRRFLARHMPELERYLHYRIIDVSTVKELVRRWYPEGPQPPEKRKTHRALDDIRESIAELRFYRDRFFRLPT